VDLLITETAVKKGRTLLVLGAIGPKFDRSMALNAWIRNKFSELDLVYGAHELITHPNLALWLKKTGTQYVAAAAAEVGVVIMPHGASQPYNDAVEEAIAPLQARYRIEMAYGMGDSYVIQQAVSRLEERSVRRIVFVRMYPLEHHLEERVKYILGLVPDLPTHDHDLEPAAQVQSAALFSTFGGYENYPSIAEILHERIAEISRNPAQETVIIWPMGTRPTRETPSGCQ
jgi:hypothetical protein